MDDSRRSIAANEDSISMYLSFDTDDTLASVSKWQSVVSHSQYIEVHGTELDLKLDKTLEDNQRMRTILKDVNTMDQETDHVSPLRPFDKSILTKHNALSSTPSKNVTVPKTRLSLGKADVDNKSDKENAFPFEEAGSDNVEGNSTLSSSVDITASTVKANTLLVDATPNCSVQQNKTNVYPLCPDVILENITEDFAVSNEEETSLPHAEDEKDAIKANEVVNEVSLLINKMLKISEDSVKKAKNLKPNPPNPKLRLSSIPLPRPRRSMLPTSGAEKYTIKQRMSVVVKTTLNSPARRLSSISSASGNRRSCLPPAGNRRSCLPAPRLRKSTNPVAKAVKNATEQSRSKIVAQPKSTFGSKHLEDNHGREMSDNLKPLKRLNNGSSSQSGINKNRCKYCDKNFALERALHIHLMQNCDKIPPSEKRKLQFTELNHVKKAELPKLGATTQQQSVYKTRPITKTPTAVGKASSSSGSQLMAPPSGNKVHKNLAHAGVGMTPTKSVVCYTCKQSFKSIIEYTDHCLAKHSKSQKVSAEAARA